jgi:MFS-type transporter involved in bile tolerance (Atg22 family)
VALTSSIASRGAFGRLWRRPRYPGFVLTVALARISSFMFNTAGVLLILARTGSAPLAGATAAAAVVPAAVTGPVLGAWLDVARRRRVLIVFDQLLSVAGLLAIVALAGRAPNWTIPAVTVLYSLTRPFSQGSFFSTLAEIAGPELLDQASAIEATSLNVIGPVLAGVLVGIIGAAVTVELQAARTIVVAALVAANPAFGRCTARRTPAAICGRRWPQAPSSAPSCCTGRPRSGASASRTESWGCRGCCGRWRDRWRPECF